MNISQSSKRSGLKAALLALFLAPAVASAQTQVTGQLANGTAYNILVPANWDGVLVVDADLPSNNSAVYRWMHSRGHATAGKSRNVTDWKVSDGSDDIIELMGIFEQRFGAPTTSIVWGRSLGGLVTRDAIEKYPTSFDGAVPMCGGGAGLVGMWNNRLDAVFALKMLIAPDNDAFQIVNITNEAAAIAALNATVALALSTPEGRAKLVLAATIAQIDGWPGNSAEPPGPDNTEAAIQAIASAYRAMLFSRRAIEAVAGGNISWNVGVNYEQMFNGAHQGAKALTRDLYAAAGLDHKADLRALNELPRIKAKRTAVQWAIDNGPASGNIEIPVLSVFTAVDPRAALSEMQAYEHTVRTAGNQPLLRQSMAYVSGHCAFRASEQAAAIDSMLERLGTGNWGSLGTAIDLNARADALNVASGGILGAEARYAEPAVLDGVAKFPRPFAEGRDPIPADAVE